MSWREWPEDENKVLKDAQIQVELAEAVAILRAVSQRLSDLASELNVEDARREAQRRDGGRRA